MKSERRSNRRVSSRLPVSLQSPRAKTVSGVTRDLSMSGVFLYTDAHILPGSELEMVLMLPPELTNGEKRWVCCQASVIRVEDGVQAGSHGIAAQIENIATLPEIPAS